VKAHLGESRVCMRMATALRFSRMSTTSYWTPSIAVYIVQHAFDFDLSDGGPGQRGQQHSAQGIAQRVTKAAFERFDHDTSMARRHGLYFDDPRLQNSLIDPCMDITYVN